MRASESLLKNIHISFHISFNAFVSISCYLKTLFSLGLCHYTPFTFSYQGLLFCIQLYFQHYMVFFLLFFVYRLGIMINTSLETLPRIKNMFLFLSLKIVKK